MQVQRSRLKPCKEQNCLRADPLLTESLTFFNTERGLHDRTHSFRLYYCLLIDTTERERSSNDLSRRAASIRRRACGGCLGRPCKTKLAWNRGRQRPTNQEPSPVRRRESLGFQPQGGCQLCWTSISFRSVILFPEEFPFIALCEHELQTKAAWHDS